MSDAREPDSGQGLISGSPSVELSSNRTSLSFERTHMSADRTLMGIIRTSLSLISFGFTIYEAFRQLEQARLIESTGSAPRNMGVSLLLLGIVMLAMGIVTHWRFGRELTKRRERLYGLHLLRRQMRYRITPTFAIAWVLLLIGVTAAFSIAARMI